MHRPGVMAPPSLYDEQPAPGLMSPDAALPPLDLSLNALFWVVATVLAAVELIVQLSLYEGLTKPGLCRRAALSAPRRRPQSAL